MKALPLLLSLVSISALAAEPSVAWRVNLGGPALSHPAVSASGRIAVATGQGLLVLDEKGRTLERFSDGVSGQPMFDGEALWYRTKEGWKRVLEGAEPLLCKADTSIASLDPTGNLLWASEKALETCDPERRVLSPRRGRSGQLFILGSGLVSADEWWLEFFDENYRPLAALRVDELGSPAGVDAEGRLLVTAPNGRLKALDGKGKVVWSGPAGDDGPPLGTAEGVLVLGGRALSLVSEEGTRWTLPVAAGVRQAAVLEGGVVALLERSGRLGLVKEGKPLWARRLQAPGQLFGAHPSGLLLVQEGTQLVAWRAPKPVSNGVQRGLDRSGRVSPSTLSSTLAGRLILRAPCEDCVVFDRRSLELPDGSTASVDSKAVRVRSASGALKWEALLLEECDSVGIFAREVSSLEVTGCGMSQLFETGLR